MNRAQRPGRRTTSCRRVVLVLESARADDAALVRGCVAAAEQTGRVEVFYRGNRGGALRGELAAAGSDVAGILCCAASAESTRCLRRQACPVVLMEQEPVAGLPLVRADNAAIGQMAAEFLLAKGHRRFGYWGVGGAYYSEQRKRSLADVIRRFGIELESCHLPPVGTSISEIQRTMKRWLIADLPSAILVDTATHARQLIATCQQLGYAIPEQVAILSCDNDDLLCATIHPSISGIDQNMRRIGYEATLLMVRLLAGETVPREPVLVPPSGVVERQSTDSFAVEDRRLASALSRIRADATAGKLAVGDVAHTAALSRRALQMLFRRVLGRTVQQEISRTRIDHARHLLLTSNLPMPDVAAHCGYESAPVFTRAFRRATATTPLAFRRSGQAAELPRNPA